MTAQRNPYVRVYYSIIDDPKFEGVYDDDTALATWLRLLLVADGTYPAPAPIPHGTRRRGLDRLVEARIVDLAPGNRFRMHGLASERQRRSLVGKAGADARWGADALPTQSDSNADALPQHSGTQSAPLHSTPSSSTPLHSDARARPNGEAPTEDQHALQTLAEDLTGQPYVLADMNSKLGQMASRQLTVHGLAAVSQTWQMVADTVGGRPTLGQLVIGAGNVLDPPPRVTPQEAKKAEKRAVIANIREKAGHAH